jgi:hypothetical protein
MAYDEGKDRKGGIMSKNGNPYPEIIIDECSGIQISNVEHRIWAEGYEAGRNDGQADEGVSLQAD